MWTVVDNKTVNMSRKQRFWINNSVLEATLNQRVAGPIPASPIGILALAKLLLTFYIHTHYLQNRKPI
jgi:hypothetical protein